MITAVASRDIERARDFAGEAQIERTFDSYDALLDDPEIDVVYNPLPNHLHVPLSISALRAGKHVLCEKPIALTSAEAEALLDESYLILTQSDGSVHVSPSSTMAACEEDHPERRDRRAPNHPVILFLLQPG